jgi:hypothetical protein
MIRATFILLLLSFFRIQAQYWQSAALTATVSSNFASSRITGDENGMLYLSVTDFEATYPFSSGPSFLKKYDILGNELWQISFEGPVRIEELAAVPHCVYAVGHFTNTLKIANSIVASHGSSDIFIAKFDPFGGLEWLRTFGSAGEDLGLGLVIGHAGALYVTGEISDTVIFDNQFLASRSKHSAFIAKLDANGQVLALQNFSCDMKGGTCYGKKLKLDSHSNGYLLGYFDASLRADTFHLANNGQPSTFLCKLDADMNVSWIQNTASAVCMTSALVTNQYNEVTTESQCSASPGGGKVFTTRYNEAGQIRWSTSLFPPQSSNDIYSESCASFDKSTLVVGNNWNCFGNSSCNQQLYIAEYDSVGNQVLLETFTSTGTDLSRIQVTQVTPSLFAVSGTLNGKLTLGNYSLDASAHPSIFLGFYSMTEATSIRNEQSIAFSVSPNPTHDLVFINAREALHVRLYDGLGNCVIQQPISSSSSSLDLGGLNRGVYFLELESGENRSMKKIVLY